MDHFRAMDSRETVEEKITPAMISAGKRELLSFDARFESEADAVERIYNAMRDAGNAFEERRKCSANILCAPREGSR
jgi:hypothetical protein